MSKEGVLIAGFVLLCVALAAADQLLHLSPLTARPPVPRSTSALATLPVAYLGSAMAVGAGHRRERPLAD